MVKDKKPLTYKQLEQDVRWIISQRTTDQRAYDEIRYDILFILNYLGLQRNTVMGPRIIPITKPPKKKFMRRFWDAVLGR